MEFQLSSNRERAWAIEHRHINTGRLRLTAEPSSGAQSGPDIAQQRLGCVPQAGGGGGAVFSDTLHQEIPLWITLKSTKVHRKFKPAKAVRAYSGGDVANEDADVCFIEIRKRFADLFFFLFVITFLVRLKTVMQQNSLLMFIFSLLCMKTLIYQLTLMFQEKKNIEVII